MTTHRKLSVHLEHEFLLKLERAGLGEAEAQAVVDDRRLAERAVGFIRRGGYKSTAGEWNARSIIGQKNFFGIEDAIERFGVTPTQKQLAALAVIPWSEVDIHEVKNTHILVACFPLSILDIRNRVPRDLFPSHEDVWYNQEEFARRRGTARWLLIRKTEMPDSLDKTWQEQQALIKDNEVIPTAQEVVYTIIGYYLAQGERLFENRYVRSSDLDSTGCRVCVGYFGLDSGVRCWWDDHCGNNLGVASVRKPTS